MKLSRFWLFVRDGLPLPTMEQFSHGTETRVIWKPECKGQWFSKLFCLPHSFILVLLQDKMQVRDKARHLICDHSSVKNCL